MIVLDASALVEIIVPTSLGQRLFELTIGADLHAPDLIDVEAVSGLRRQARMGNLTPEEGAAALDDVLTLPLHRHPRSSLLSGTWRWRENLSTYDALYLELAIAAEAPLLTIDRGLAGVARDLAGVELLGPLA